jgi:hypothetical protein
MHCMYNGRNAPVLHSIGNPQTDKLLKIFELEHQVTIPFDLQATANLDRFNHSNQPETNRKDSNEIKIKFESDNAAMENENKINIDENLNEWSKKDHEMVKDNAVNIDKPLLIYSLGDNSHLPAKKPRCSS